MRVNYKRLFLPFLAIATLSFGSFASALEGGTHSNGDTYLIANNYAELVEALADADSKYVSVQGDITLENDITINKQLSIDAAITFDANGKTVTTTNVIRGGGYSYAFNIHEDMTVTGDGNFEIGGYYGFQTYGGNLTVENGTFEATNDDPYYIFWSSEGDITLKNGNYKSAYIIANNYSSDSTISLQGGTYESEDWAVINSSNGGTVEINGEGVKVTTEYDFFVAAEEEPDDYGAVDCIQGTIMVLDENTMTVCGETEEPDEDGEVAEGTTVNLLNGTEVTFPKGIKLTNNGLIYVDATSSISVCRDDYVGDEDAITGEGTISFDCEEEEEEEPEPEVDPEVIPEAEPTTIEIDNPDTGDNVSMYLGILGISLLGILLTLHSSKERV